MRYIEDKMEKKIDKLEKEINAIKSQYKKVMAFSSTEPEVSMTLSRKVVELICKQVIRIETGEKVSNKATIQFIIEKMQNSNLLPHHILVPIKTIQNYGNFAAHDQGDSNIDFSDVYIQPALKSLTIIIKWFFLKYGDFMSQKDLLNDIDHKKQENENGLDKFDEAKVDKALSMIIRLDVMKKRIEKIKNILIFIFLAAYFLNVIILKITDDTVYFVFIILSAIAEYTYFYFYEIFVKRKIKMMNMNFIETKTVINRLKQHKWKNKKFKKDFFQLLVNI